MRTTVLAFILSCLVVPSAHAADTLPALEEKLDAVLRVNQALTYQVDCFKQMHSGPRAIAGLLF